MPRTTPNLPFAIRRSSIQGKGAFATRTIRKGSKIIEYTGERIDQEEADRRYDDAEMKRHHTFLFALDDGSNIDGASGGNESRFINHSCAPNCAAYETDGHIFIEALRTIQPGEELGYDYAFARTRGMTKEDEKHYKCLCGAPTCRGTILVPRKKPAAKKKVAAKKKSVAVKKKTAGAKKAAGAALTKVARGALKKAAGGALKKAAGGAKKTAGGALKKAAAALKKAAAALKKAAGTRTRSAKKPARR